MSTLRMIGELALNASGWYTGLDRAEKAGNAFGKRVSSTLEHHLAAAFGGAMILHHAKEVMEYGAQIYNVSRALQVSKKDLQEFDYAAKESGASLEDIEKGFRALAKARTEALEGNSGKMKIFEAFGVPNGNLKMNSLADTFRAIGETIYKKNFGNNELGMTEEIFGRNAEAMLKIFKNGLAEASAEAERLGLVLGDDVVDNLKRSHDELHKLELRMRGPFAEAVILLSKLLRGMWDSLDASVGGIGAYATGFIEAARATPSAKGGGSSLLGPGTIESFKNIGKWNKAGVDSARAHVDDVIENRRKLEEEELSKLEAKQRMDKYFAFQDAKAAEEAKKVLRIREQIDDIRRKTSMRGLDENQKEERLLNEIWRKRMEIDKMRREGKPESEQLEKQKDIAHLQDELANLREDRRKHEAEFGILKPQDSLAKTGLFTQFADAYLPLKTPLERIATATEATAANTGNRSGLLDPAGLIGGGF